jgi:hypothetical protein
LPWQRHHRCSQWSHKTSKLKAPQQQLVQKITKKNNTWVFDPASWWQLDPLREYGSMHDILLLEGFWCQKNDGEALVLACLSPVLGWVQPELAGGDTYQKYCQCHDIPRGDGEVMTSHFYAGTIQDYADLLPGGSYWWHWIKRGHVGFWKIGKIGLPADPMPFVSFAQKILTVNPPKKRTFVFCA